MNADTDMNNVKGARGADIGRGMPPGLQQPVMDSQFVFRAVLLALSRPGTIVELGRLPQPPAPLFPSTAAMLLSLCDMDTPLWLGPAMLDKETAGYFRFHCGCQLTATPEHAAFAVIQDGMKLPDLTRFRVGTPEYPDRGATLIVQVDSLECGVGWRISGPGVKGAENLDVRGLSRDFWPFFAANREKFPTGVDVLLVTKASVCGLPRSARVEGW